MRGVPPGGPSLPHERSFIGHESWNRGRPPWCMEGVNVLGRKGAVVRTLPVMLLVGCIAGSGCSSDHTSAHTKGDRIAVRGKATLDGAPFDAEFLGAVVRRGGLVTPCQAEIPPVTRGRYEITVLAQSAGSGCGRRGARVLLWTYVGNTKLYSTSAVSWPPRRNSANFNARFSTVMPKGEAPSVTELSGEVFDRDGRRLPAGTRVEAYVGTTRCGIASVRRAGENFTGYILSVVGPDSINGCTQDAEITFQVNGRPATETYPNQLTGGAPGSGGSFPLTQS